MHLDGTKETVAEIPGGPNGAAAYITASATGKLLTMQWPRPGAKLNHLNT